MYLTFKFMQSYNLVHWKNIKALLITFTFKEFVYIFLKARLTILPKSRKFRYFLFYKTMFLSDNFRIMIELNSLTLIIVRIGENND